MTGHHGKMRIVTEINENGSLMKTRRTKKNNDRFTEVSPSDLNVRRIVFLVFMGLILPVFQEAFFNDLRVFGVKPNLALVFLVTVAIVMNERDAMFFGLGQGLILDVIFGKISGIYALLFTAVGFLLALIFRDRFKRTVWMSLPWSPLIFFAYGFTESFLIRAVNFLFVLGGTGSFYADFGEHILVRILPVALYNLAVFIVFLYPIRLLWRFLGILRNRKVAFDRRYDDAEET